MEKLEGVLGLNVFLGEEAAEVGASGVVGKCAESSRMKGWGW